MGLSPHTTHLLQPLHVGICNHMKMSCKQISLSSRIRNSKFMIIKSFIQSLERTM